MNTNLLGNICSVISSLAAAGATFIAAGSLKFSYREQKRVRQSEKSKSLMDYKIHWYNEIVLNDVLHGTYDFIEKSNTLIEKTKKDNLKEDGIKNIYDEIRTNYEQSIEKIYILKIFDRSLFQDCEKVFQEILDIYAEITETSLSKISISPYKQSMIQKNKVDISRRLLQYGIDIIERNEKRDF